MIDFLKKHFKQGTEIDGSNIFAAVFIGSSAHIFLYFIHKYFFNLNESLYLRAFATFLCLTVGFYHKIPRKIKETYFPIYWHLMLIVALPLSISYGTLTNNFHEMWLLWMVFMPIALSIFVPSWFVFTADLLIGICGAFSLYLLTHKAESLEIREGCDFYSFALVFIFSAVAGIIFVFGNRRAWLAKQNVQHKKLTAIAASIAHELRNPINAIKLSSDSLNEKNEISPYKDQISKILSLANQIIDMTLHQLSGKDLDPTDFSILSAKSSILEAVSIYGYKSNSEKEKLKIDFGNNNVFSAAQISKINPESESKDYLDFKFKGIETAFKYLIFNLVKNSLFYLGEYKNSVVTIGIEKDKELVFEDLNLGNPQTYNIIYIHDTGPGISKENLATIFGDFVTSGKKGGTGLGLSFCKRVMHGFGGDIICESEFGKWTKFSLLFPKLSDEDLINFQSQNNKKKILIVDDEKTNLLITKSKIEKNLNFICDFANNGEEAIKMVRKNSDYQLILMDIQMPEMNGIESAKIIKSFNSRIPIVALTSLEHELIFENSHGYFDYYLNKPVAGHILHRTIAKLTMCEDNLDYLGSEDQYLPTLKGKNIILADDQELNRVITVKKLSSLGLKIIQAKDGKELVEIYKKSFVNNKKSDIDLIITDINMPPFNGDDAAQEIRKIESQNNIKYNEQIPIIALSGDGQEENIKHFFNCQITDYFIKGDNTEKLFKIIASYLNPNKIFYSKEFLPKTISENQSSAKEQETKILNSQKLRYFNQEDKVKFLKIFLSEINAVFNQIKQGFKNSDQNQMSLALHALKGISGNIGAEKLLIQIKEIEAELKQNKSPSNKNWLLDLQNSYQDLKKEVEKLLLSKKVF